MNIAKDRTIGSIVADDYRAAASRFNVIVVIANSPSCRPRTFTRPSQHISHRLFFTSFRWARWGLLIPSKSVRHVRSQGMERP